MAERNNKNLNEAKKAKNDEFYTKEEDIRKEISNYLSQIKGKVIYCNCDTEKSNFWIHLKNNFHSYKLKHLIATGLGGERLDFNGIEVKKTKLQGNGSYNSPECIGILNNEADIVFTNPPFSLWRDYIDTLEASGKDYLILGSTQALVYKNVFPLIKSGRLKPGYTFDRSMTFDLPGGKEKKVSCAFWTTLKVKPNPPLVITESFDPQKNPKFDNYCAFNVDRVKDIPKDTYIELEIPDEDYDLWKNVYGEDLEVIL